MNVFAAPSFANHEEVVFCNDPQAGLKAIIAIHDTTLGPALGGCRMWPYASEQAALEDVLRLSRGMTYKAALADLDRGGGKAVIIGDPRHDKTPALFHGLGRFVEGLGGRYIVAEDVGTSVPDLEIVRQQTRHVAGIAEGGSGDPSPATAWGVYHGIKAAVRHRLGRQDVDGLRIAVQGLGHVGEHLCRHLAEHGARLIVSDIDAQAVRRAQERFGAAALKPDDIYEAEADVFAPCAMGAILNDETIPRLKVSIVAGAANNQLARDHHGRALSARGILYAPDYVINAGGIINISHEGRRYDKSRAFNHIAGIDEKLAELFERAEAERVPTNVMADRLAEERVAGRRSAGHRVALAAVS